MSNQGMCQIGSVSGTHQNNTDRINPNRKKHRRQFNRALLPTPATYYSQEFPGLKIKSEWVKVKCCFHKDDHPSLNISMIKGHFRCFACGAKGGDVLAFHQLKHGVSFPEAVSYMGAWAS